MKIKFGTGVLLAAMLFLSMAFVPAVSGYIERNSDQDVPAHFPHVPHQT